MERNISVIKDVNGNQIVIVNDIRFKGKRNIKGALEIGRAHV